MKSQGSLKFETVEEYQKRGGKIVQFRAAGTRKSFTTVPKNDDVAIRRLKWWRAAQSL